MHVHTYIYLPRFSHVRSMYVCTYIYTLTYVLREICTVQVYSNTYVRMYVNSGAYIHACTQVRVKKTSVQQTGLQGISKKGNNHSSCAFNASTSVYAYGV